ncbi:MAG: ammonia-forming cytochrome c nitrite reductase subunit c552, partial [Chloroflexota bacterium]
MNQLVVRRLGLALAGLIVGLLIPTYIIAQEIPPIPHKLENRSDCLACHAEGKLKSPQIPDDHAGRPNDICQDCHRPVAELPATAESGTPTGPPPVPHTLVGHENCLECHISPEATAVSEEGPPAIPHTLIGRENCLACHEEGIGDAPQIPADHAGRPNDICQACHEPAQLPAAPTPTPPTEPIPTPIAYPRAQGVDTCVDCHLTLEDEKQVEISTRWQRSIHAERNVSCADCHGGDPSATPIDEAMSPAAGYIGAPKKADIPALCASCHADVTQMRQYDLPTDQYAKYKESIHGLRL